LFQDYAVLPPKEANPKAKAAAIKALEIDDTLAEAHASLGLSKVNDWDLAGAESEYKRAIALNSNYATVHHWYGEGCLIWLGRFDEAIAEMKRARELDPFSLIINTDSAQVLVWSRHYDEAIDQCRKTLEMDQNFSLTHSYLGQAYVLKGMYAEGIAEFQKAVALDEAPSYVGYLGHAYAVSGRRADALKTLDELKRLSKRRYVSPFWFALIYMGLDDKDRTFEWLEKAYDDHFVNIMDLSTNPYFDSLRSDPRRSDLLRRVGLD